MTELPSKDILQRQLEKSLEEARLKAGRCGVSPQGGVADDTARWRTPSTVAQDTLCPP